MTFMILVEDLQDPRRKMAIGDRIIQKRAS